MCWMLIVWQKPERLLRTRRYLRKVEVRVSHQCPDQQVVVTISSWDNWSLLPKNFCQP